MITETRTPQSVLALGRELDVKIVNLRFADLLGRWQWCSVPIAELSEERFEDGFALDGSGYAGWRTRDSTDLLLVPQPETAFFDPFATVPTLNLLCSIQDPQTGDDFLLDPRSVADKAISYLSGTGLADRALFGSEIEFYVFDAVEFGDDAGRTSYTMTPDSGDEQSDFVGEMMQSLLACGVPVETYREPSSEAGQFEICLRHGDLLRAADMIMVAKYVVKNVARRLGKTATFMPKPLGNRCGSGLHTHLSLWRGQDLLFAGNEYAGLSDAGLGAIGGLLRRLPALVALTSPSTNSYKRLSPVLDAPVYAAYSQRNRGTAVRVPTFSRSPKTKQIEFRVPDASCNPYLAFSAILMAVLDGVQNKISPGDPQDSDLHQMPEDARRLLPQTPESLSTALASLAADHDFLLRGDVFSMPLIEAWIRCKRTLEIDPMRSRPHPKEFELYYDI